MTIHDRYPVVLTALRIRDILKNQTDADHPITKAAIAEQMHCDWRKIANCLDEMDIHNMIRYEEQRGKGIYYVPDETKDFTLAEIRMLIDSVLASRQISSEETQALANKLRSQLNEYDRRHVRYVATSKGAGQARPTCTYENIELLDRAMEQGCQVSFDYMTYSISKTLVREGSYQVSPYQTIFAGGFYMVLAMLDGEVRSFRLDRIANLQLLSKVSAVPPHLGKNPERCGSIYVQNHPYMQVGEVSYIEVALQEEAIDRAIDAFGEGIRIFPERDDLLENEVLVCFHANTEDVYLWALQNADVATVMKPQSLRDRLRRISVALEDSYLTHHADWVQANLDNITGAVKGGLGRYFNHDILMTNIGSTLAVLEKKNLQYRVKNVLVNYFDPEIARALQEYHNVEDLSIYTTTGEPVTVRDLSAFAHMKKLTELGIYDCGMEDLSGIAAFPALESLKLYHPGSCDLAPIYGLKQLKELVMDKETAKRLDLERLRSGNPDLKIDVS